MLDEDRRQAEEEEKKQDLERKQLLHDYQETFRTPPGRRVFRDLMEKCHIFHTTFTGNSKTFFLEGERNMGLYLLAMMEQANIEGLKKLKELEEEKNDGRQ